MAIRSSSVLAMVPFGWRITPQCTLGHPAIIQKLGPIHIVGSVFIIRHLLAVIRADVFPDDLAIGGYLEDSSILAFIDERVAVGQALCAADEGAVERP